jgi:HK97 gp10 family phage protein
MEDHDRVARRCAFALAVQGATGMKIEGLEKHAARLKRLSGAPMQKEVRKLVYTLADMHATEAALSITRGAVSGKNHVASNPGEPPNADTHFLDRSIEATLTGPVSAESSANAPYAAALEFGTSRMAERPFMRPAAKTVRKEVDQLARAAVRRVTQGGVL